MGIARKYRSVIPRQQGPTLTRLILKKIGEAGEVLLDSFFPAKYPEARIWRKLLGLDPSYEFKHPTFSAILAKLRAEGLIEKTSKHKKGYWRLTARGRNALTRQGEILPNPDGRKRLVCFDIPELDRAKRRWLRGELLALGYRPLQKSVWIGEVPLPEDFIEELDVLRLRNQVHLFQIEFKGTLDK